MGSGRFYAVDESAREVLGTCRTKADWYEAMSTLDIERAPQLDAEDSIRFWASKLETIGHPSAKFFIGDLHAEYDGSDDPNVCFVSRASTDAFLSQLAQLGEQFFLRLFPHEGPHGMGHAWLYEPLYAFLKETSQRGNAVVILWEN